jgi:hypothetical protein
VVSGSVFLQTPTHPALRSGIDSSCIVGCVEPHLIPNLVPVLPLSGARRTPSLQLPPARHEAWFMTYTSHSFSILLHSAASVVQSQIAAFATDTSIDQVHQ